VVGVLASPVADALEPPDDASVLAGEESPVADAFDPPDDALVVFTEDFLVVDAFAALVAFAEDFLVVEAFDLTAPVSRKEESVVLDGRSRSQSRRGSDGAAETPRAKAKVTN